MELSSHASGIANTVSKDAKLNYLMKLFRLHPKIKKFSPLLVTQLSQGNIGILLSLVLHEM